MARISVVLALLGAAVMLARTAGPLLPQFAQWIDGLGVWGPVAFVLGYAVLVVGFVPGIVLTMAAGATFGVAVGTGVVLVGATLGATVAFLVSRHFGRGLVARWIERDARFQAIDRAVERQGRSIVLLLRLSPIFPFNLLNYALGLTRVRLRDYVLASVGMLPGTILYVYSGKLVGDLGSIAGGVGPARGAGYYALLGLGFAATALVTTVITRIARRALESATGIEPS